MGSSWVWQRERTRSDRFRWDAEAVTSVEGSPSGAELELKITKDPVHTEPVDRPQARPAQVSRSG